MSVLSPHWSLNGCYLSYRKLDGSDLGDRIKIQPRYSRVTMRPQRPARLRSSWSSFWIISSSTSANRPVYYPNMQRPNPFVQLANHDWKTSSRFLLAYLRPQQQGGALIASTSTELNPRLNDSIDEDLAEYMQIFESFIDYPQDEPHRNELQNREEGCYRTGILSSPTHTDTSSKIQDQANDQPNTIALCSTAPTFSKEDLKYVECRPGNRYLTMHRLGPRKSFNTRRRSRVHSPKLLKIRCHLLPFSLTSQHATAMKTSFRSSQQQQTTTLLHFHLLLKLRTGQKVDRDSDPR